MDEPRKKEVRDITDMLLEGLDDTIKESIKEGLDKPERKSMNKFEFHLDEKPAHQDRIATLFIDNEGTLELHINGAVVFTINNKGEYNLEYARESGLPVDKHTGLLMPY